MSRQSKNGSKIRHCQCNDAECELSVLVVVGWRCSVLSVVIILCSANPENDQYRRPADPSRPSQIGPQAYLVLDVFNNKVFLTH